MKRIDMSLTQKILLSLYKRPASWIRLVGWYHTVSGSAIYQRLRYLKRQGFILKQADNKFHISEAGIVKLKSKGVL